jgi:hypothetical protein
MALGCFSTFAVQFLPADLLGGIGKLKFQRAAQVASVAIGLAAGTKPVVLWKFYHIPPQAAVEIPRLSSPPKPQGCGWSIPGTGR